MPLTTIGFNQTLATIMIDPSDLLELPKSFFVGVLRALWWLAWDFCVETVGWSVGWLMLRLITFGQFPREPLSGVEQASTALSLFVEAVGLATLATSIWLLSGSWPDF